MSPAGRIARTLVLSVLAPAATATAQTPNPTLQALPPGWSELPGSDMAAAGWTTVPDCDYGNPCEIASGNILSYSGAVLDVARQRIVLWGGGHNDFFGNQLLLFDLATLAWQIEQPPTSITQYGAEPDYEFANGLPVSRHTYDHLGIITHLGGLFFAFSGACAERPLFNDGRSFGDVWTYDFDAGSWTDHTDEAVGNDGFHLRSPGASGEYDPVTERWYQLTQYGIWSYDFETKTFELVSEDGPPGIERTSVLDTRRRLIWSYGGQYGGDANLSAFDVDAGTFEIVSSVNEPGVRSAAGLTYDPIDDRLVLFGGAADSSVWSYDPDSASWSEHADPGGPAGSSVYGRFLYEPVNDVFLLVDDADSVWVWKRVPSALLFQDGFESGDTSAWSATSGP